MSLPRSPHGKPRRDAFLQTMSRLNTSVSQRHPLHTAPLFSWCYKTLFPQPVCSHIYTKPRGCRGHRHSRQVHLRATPRQIRGKFFRCHTYKECPPKSFRCHTYKIALPQVLSLPHIRKTGGVG